MKSRLRYLTISLVLLLLLLPFLEGGKTGPILYSILVSITFAAGIYALSQKRRDVVVGLAFGLPWFVLSWVVLLTRTPSPTMLLFLGAFWSLFFGFTALVLLSFLLKSERVSEDVLYGAAAVYLLTGGTWAGIYSLVETVAPGSFVFEGGLNPDGVIGAFDFVYFSFTTLTTMG